MNHLKKVLIVAVFLQSWFFFGFLLTTNSPSENSTSITANPSLKTSSNKVIVRVLDETQVNYNFIDNQQNPSICALSNDTFAVAWESYEQDGWSWGIYASVFNATTGDNITSEFRVNQYTDKTQADPSICALSNETFAVAWESSDQDIWGNGVYARVFDATTGQQITPEFQVNHFEAYDQENPSICALSSDTFAIAFDSYGQYGSSWSSYTSVFSAITGNNITSEFRVNQYFDNSPRNPSICALSNDTFAVTWDSISLAGIRARVLNATTGKNITSEFKVEDDNTCYQVNPSICALSNDTFAAAWDSYLQDDGTSYGVYAGVIEATTGDHITSEFRVNEYIEKDQDSPAICALSSDMFVVTWESLGQDGSGDGVYAKIFNATTGKHIISEFQVNDRTQYIQRNPTICDLSNDTFAIAWESNEQDGDQFGVYCSIFKIENQYPSNSLPFGTSNGNDDGDDKDDNDSIPFGSLYFAIFLVSVLSLVIITRYKILKNGVKK